MTSRFRFTISALRNYSSYNGNEKQEAIEWLNKLTPNPKTQLKHFEIKFARSSGAGGQHVNTTDSKAIIRIGKNEWYGLKGRFINSLVFEEIMNNYRDSNCPNYKKFPYFTQKGDVLISSEQTRYRDKNLHDCLDKFIRSVKECGAFKKEVDKETVENWNERKKKDNEKRLNSKKFQKDKKQFRKKVSLD